MNINYIRTGDYFIPDLKLPEETRPTGKWGRIRHNLSGAHDDFHQLPKSTSDRRLLLPWMPWAGGVTSGGEGLLGK